MCSIQAKKVTVQARKVTETGVAKQEPAVASEQLEAAERRQPNIVSHLALFAHPLQPTSTTTTARATAEGRQRGRLALKVPRQLQSHLQKAAPAAPETPSKVPRQLQSHVQKAAPAAPAQATEEGRQRGRLAIASWDSKPPEKGSG
jgi:hypothetical protein